VRRQVADNFENFLAVCFQMPNLLVLALIVFYQLEEWIPRHVTILVPLLFSLALMLVQLALTKVRHRLENLAPHLETLQMLSECGVNAEWLLSEC
jgi:SNF family Na+-dependent transporter